MLEKQGKGKTSAGGNVLHLENLSDPKIRARPSRDHTVRDFALTIRLLLQQGRHKRKGMLLCHCKLKASIGRTSLSDDRIKPCLAPAPLPFAVYGRMVNRQPVKTSPTNGSLSAEVQLPG